MILIADSGSTKTDWALLAASGKYSTFTTQGINPFFLTEEQISCVVSNELLPQLAEHLWIGPITNVFFYGSGCTPEKKPQVKSALECVFPRAVVEVESDMLGAARALFGDSEIGGVACILGTGSNVVLFEGGQMQSYVPSLGYILGDEGSGAVMGKRLVSALLMNEMGDYLKTKFLERYHTTQAEIIDNVYRRPLPNRYLAQFTRFASDNIENPRISEFVKAHFSSFAERVLENYPKCDIGFVGSVAYYFQNILTEVLKEKGWGEPAVIQSPLKDLVNYHRKDVCKE